MSAATHKADITRRQFLIAGAGVAGSLVLGVPRLTFADGDDDRMKVRH